MRLTKTKEAYQVFGLDGDTLGVNSGEVGVLEERDEVRLGRLLERHHRRGLEAEVGLAEGGRAVNDASQDGERENRRS